MLSTLGSAASDAWIDFARHAQRRRKTATQARRALIIPPAQTGSLGDTAMVSGAAQTLRDQGVGEVDLAYGKPWDLEVSIDRRLHSGRYFSRGNGLQRAMLVARLPRYTETYFLGADIIDGAYNPGSVKARLSLLTDAARLGQRATLLGASYNDHPEASTREALRTLPAEITLCARDPISQGRMTQALDREIRLVADLAFLVSPRPQTPAALAASRWITARRAAGDRVIGFNASTLLARKDARYTRAALELLERLLQRGISAVLVPSDVRSELTEEQLLSNLATGLSQTQRERVFMLEYGSPGATTSVLGEVDLLVTGRMHAAILALRSGTPAFSVVYQGKFEGLLMHFGLEQQGLHTSVDAFVTDTQHAAERVYEALERTPELRAMIASRWPHVHALALANFG